MSAATVDLLRLKMFLKRKADRQRRGKIFDACRHSDTRAQQFVVAADDRGAADFAAVDERQHHEVAAFVQGQLIFERRRKAAFAAEKTFLVAAHAVAAAYVKSVRRRQIFAVAELRVNPALQNLPAAELLLVNQIQLINRRVAFVVLSSVQTKRSSNFVPKSVVDFWCVYCKPAS